MRNDAPRDENVNVSTSSTASEATGWRGDGDGDDVDRTAKDEGVVVVVAAADVAAVAAVAAAVVAANAVAADAVVVTVAGDAATTLAACAGGENEFALTGTPSDAPRDASNEEAAEAVTAERVDGATAVREGEVSCTCDDAASKICISCRACCKSCLA